MHPSIETLILLLINNYHFLLYSLLFLVVSCSQSEGKWDDNIGLSAHEVNFSSSKDSVIITTEGSWWWINSISLNDSTYSYYFNDDVDLESDTFIIKEDDFSIERRNKNTLFILMEENASSEERILKIWFQAGNYFDHVFITQATKQ